MPRPTQLVVAVILAVALLTACGDGTATLSYQMVSPAAAAEIIGEETPIVLDVRTPEEFATGHLAGAVNIDFYASDFVAQLGALDREAGYVVYCRSGNRSEAAVQTMRELDFTAVWEIAGGIEAWIGAGYGVGD